MAMAKCSNCGRCGNIGNTIFRHRVYSETGQRRKVMLCNRCESVVKFEIKPRPDMSHD